MKKICILILMMAATLGFAQTATRPAEESTQQMIAVPSAEVEQHPRAELPTSIHIRGELWVITYLKHLTFTKPDGGVALMSGWTDCDGNTIQVRLSDGCDQADSILHELMHASMCNIHNPEFEERPLSVHEVITEMAGPLSVVLGQNPEILNFLASATKNCEETQ